MNSREGRRDHISTEVGTALPRFPSLHFDLSATAHMFVEDIASSIVPFNTRSGTLKAVISGESSAADRVRVVLASLGGRDRYDAGELVASSIEKVARNLAWFGRSPYEIARAKDERDGLLLRGFTPQRLFRFANRWVQLVPMKDRHLWNKSINWLSVADVWVISMPKELGGYRGYRSILRKLQRSSDLGPRFWRHDLESGIPLSTNFEFQVYRREIEAFQARATKRWGWNGRDFSGRNRTEFTQFYRTLTFRWAQAVLREHIISEFNHLFSRLGIAATISVSGMPLPHEVLYLRQDMKAGNISYVRPYEASSMR